MCMTECLAPKNLLGNWPGQPEQCNEMQNIVIEHLWLFKKLQYKKKNQWFNLICAVHRALQTDCSSFQHFKDAQPLSLMFWCYRPQLDCCGRVSPLIDSIYSCNRQLQKALFNPSIFLTAFPILDHPVTTWRIKEILKHNTKLKSQILPMNDFEVMNI